MPSNDGTKELAKLLITPLVAGLFVIAEKLYPIDRALAITAGGASTIMLIWCIWVLVARRPIHRSISFVAGALVVFGCIVWWLQVRTKMGSNDRKTEVTEPHIQQRADGEGSVNVVGSGNTVTTRENTAKGQTRATR